MKTKGLVIVIFLISSLFSGVSAVPYYEDDFEIYGKTLTHNPTVCAYEPETQINDAWKKLYRYTLGAISDWQNKLNSAGKNRNAWNIDLQLISLERQQEPANCDVSIFFLPKPQNPDEEFKMVGITMDDGINNQIMIVYYLAIDVEKIVYTKPSEDPNFYYQVTEFVPHYANYLAPESDIRMTIKHEFGHAIGLGHYITQDSERLQRWYDGIERPPSIMIPLKPTKVISYDIQPLDVEKVYQIYGNDGFYEETFLEQIQPNEVTIPKWIRNNAKWWSEGKISDKDFASGIEYLIQKEIIKITSTSIDSSSSEQVPSWLRKNAGWWSQGLLSDDEFVKGIQYLVSKGIIRISQIESTCLGSAQCFSGSVTQVIDGDTIKVDGKSIRFALASAPELNEFGGMEAKQFVERLCPVGSHATIDEDDRQTQGSYGRIIGVVYCNGVNLNEMIIKEGFGYLTSGFCDTSEFSTEPWAQKYGCFSSSYKASQPKEVKQIPKEQTKQSTSNCDPSYLDVCIPPYPPDLDCDDIPYKNFILPTDPHRFDRDKDGIGCES